MSRFYNDLLEVHPSRLCDIVCCQSIISLMYLPCSKKNVLISKVRASRAFLMSALLADRGDCAGSWRVSVISRTSNIPACGPSRWSWINMCRWSENPTSTPGARQVYVRSWNIQQRLKVLSWVYYGWMLHVFKISFKLNCSYFYHENDWLTCHSYCSCVHRSICDTGPQ